MAACAGVVDAVVINNTDYRVQIAPKITSGKYNNSGYQVVLLAGHAADTVNNADYTIRFGFFTSFSNLTVGLEYPPDNSVKVSNVTFNCSAETNSELVNMTLWGSWGQWHANETKIISGRQDSAAFTKTLPYGVYLWNCQAENLVSDSVLADENHTLIINNPPGISGMMIAPAVANTTDDLTCRWYVNDPDPNNITVNVSWYKNGVQVSVLDTSVSCQNGVVCYTTISAANTAKGQVWVCGVNANDGINLTGWTNSTSAIIANSPPSAPALRMPANNTLTVDKSPLFVWGPSTDADDDTISYSLIIDDDPAFGSPVRKNNTGATYLSLDENLSAGLYYWAVEAGDGENVSRSTGNTITINESITTNLTWNLKTGWNLVSLPFNASYKANDVCGLAVNATQIQKWNASAQNWGAIHFCSLPGFNNFDVSADEAFYIRSFADETVVESGAVTEIQSITAPGWNLVSWVYRYNTTAEAFAGSLEADVIARPAGHAGGNYSFYMAGEDYNNFDVSAGGYWVHLPGSGTLPNDNTPLHPQGLIGYAYNYNNNTGISNAVVSLTNPAANTTINTTTTGGWWFFDLSQFKGWHGSSAQINISTELEEKSTSLMINELAGCQKTADMPFGVFSIHVRKGWNVISLPIQ